MRILFIIIEVNFQALLQFLLFNNIQHLNYSQLIEFQHYDSSVT